MELLLDWDIHRKHIQWDIIIYNIMVQIIIVDELIRIYIEVGAVIRLMLEKGPILLEYFGKTEIKSLCLP